MVFKKGMESLKQRGKLYIGAKPVEVKKITIAQWKQLFGTIEALPQLILDVMMAPQEDRAAYFIVAAERSFDEVTNIISILTGLDADYIEQHADLSQLLEYVTQMAKVNDFSDIAKNIKRVLALGFKGQASESANQEPKGDQA